MQMLEHNNLAKMLTEPCLPGFEIIYFDNAGKVLKQYLL